jgi:hypothetical protein
MKIVFHRFGILTIELLTILNKPSRQAYIQLVTIAYLISYQISLVVFVTFIKLIFTAVYHYRFKNFFSPKEFYLFIGLFEKLLSK